LALDASITARCSSLISSGVRMEMRVIEYLLVSMLIEKPAYPLFFIRKLNDDGRRHLELIRVASKDSVNVMAVPGVDPVTGEMLRELLVDHYGSFLILTTYR
jgi:hypothetical protein